MQQFIRRPKRMLLGVALADALSRISFLNTRSVLEQSPLLDRETLNGTISCARSRRPNGC
jgi:hypothetical protein